MHAPMGSRTLLTAFLAAAALSAAAAARAVAAHETPARVEALEGRISVALPSGVMRLERGAPPQQFDGPVHLELSAASRVRVGWSGLGSLLVEGRGVLEWGIPAQANTPIRWTFVEVDRASLEVRRGRVHLELPGGWRGLLQPGAYTLKGLPGGPVELRHDAGLPVTLWPPPGAEKAQPPYTVLAGSSVRLLAEAPRPMTLPGSASTVQAPHDRLGFESRRSASGFPYAAWEGFSWPWARPEEASAPRSAPPDERPGADPAGQGPVATETAAQGPAATEPVPSGPAATAEGQPTTGQEALVRGETPAVEPAAEGPAEEPLVTIWTFLPLRNSGELVMTPYGPRWVDIVQLLSRVPQPPAEER